jgi:hypothetical protein
MQALHDQSAAKMKKLDDDHRAQMRDGREMGERERTPQKLEALRARRWNETES